ncbi:MAG: serine O-acetyltransferase [Cyanobacteria bacterium REEB67]|nr:serine O-acetyltransferase [Cyanobacteria bacterium REEB67]
MYLRESLKNILEKDPAARSSLEVVLCYPGFHALFFHKFAHALWLKKIRTPARFISHLGRVFTGIEIHPGATIGRRVFIDHGMGVVIGETAVIGDDCVIYQAVTLGAGAAARQGAISRDTKRHPTLGQGVIVGSGAEIQGPITVGDNVRVASGSIVLKDVPANSVVVGVPGRVIYQDGQKVEKPCSVEESPDLELQAIRSLKEHMDKLQAEVVTLKKNMAGMDATLSGSNYPTLKNQNGESDPSDPIDVFLQGSGI